MNVIIVITVLPHIRCHQAAYRMRKIGEFIIMLLGLWGPVCASRNMRSLLRTRRTKLELVEYSCWWWSFFSHCGFDKESVRNFLCYSILYVYHWSYQQHTNSNPIGIDQRLLERLLPTHWLVAFSEVDSVRCRLYSVFGWLVWRGGHFL